MVIRLGRLHRLAALDMKNAIFLAITLTFSMMVLTGAVRAEGGVGVCAAGLGASLHSSSAPSYVGVNAGTNSESGMFSERSSFESQCCAETGQPPECFAPAA